MGNQVQKGPGVKKLRKLFNSPGLGMHSQRAMWGDTKTLSGELGGTLKGRSRNFGGIPAEIWLNPTGAFGGTLAEADRAPLAEPWLNLTGRLWRNLG